MHMSTEGLELVAMTEQSAGWIIDDPAQLAALLEAEVPNDWPPEHVDAPAMAYMRERLALPGHVGWWLWFIVGMEPDGTRRLVGAAGYKGPPADGAVEIGYSVVPSEQNRGYATKAIRGLIERAWAAGDVERVVVETLPHLAPSIRVVEKLGFRFVGPGSEEGVIRYELTRGAVSQS